MNQSDSLQNLAAALAKAQALIPAPKRTHTATVPMKSGGKFSYTYSTLDDLVNVLRKPLADAGLAYVQRVTTDTTDRGLLLGVETLILHASGEWLTTGLIRLPAGDTAQTAGSACTYARRYSLGAAFGLAAEEDDDGATATVQPARTTIPEPAEPGSYDGLDEGEVLVTSFKRANSKPGAPKAWSAGFVTFSNGVEGGSFDEAVISLLQQAHINQVAVRYVAEPSKKDPAKLNITAAAFAESVTF